MIMHPRPHATPPGSSTPAGTHGAADPGPDSPPVPDAEFGRAYAQLRALAQRMLQDQRAGHTLQATALVHEAYINILDGSPSTLADPGRFQRVAAVAMRNILIDYARGRNRQKRGGGVRQLPLDALELAGQGATDDILCVDEAITRLAGERPELAELVRLRFFCGLTIEEAAKALGQSERTAYRDWTYAKALLLRELRE